VVKKGVNTYQQEVSPKRRRLFHITSHERQISIKKESQIEASRVERRKNLIYSSK